MLQKKESYSYSLLLLFLLLPSLVFLKELPLPGGRTLYPGLQSGQKIFDLFCYYKSLLIPLCSVTALGLFFWGNRLKIDRRWLIPSSLILLAIVVSTLASPYKPIPYRGSIELFETAFVWASYVVLFILGYHMVQDRSLLKRHIVVMFLGLIPLVLIGLFQFWGNDPFQWLWVKRLIVPQSVQDLRESFSFSEEAQEVYSTLGNPNYIGSLIPLLLPLSFYVVFTRRSPWTRLLGGFCTLALLVLLIGSRSRAGVVGMIGSGVVLWVLYIRSLPKWANMAIPLCTALLLIVGAFWYIKSEGAPRGGDISQIDVTESGFTVETQDVELTLKVEKGEIVFRGLGDMPLTLKMDAERERYLISDAEYEEFSFRFGTEPTDHLKLYYKGFCYVFYIIKGKFWIRYYDGAFQEISEPARLEFLDQYEHLASDRVYIWSRSIPLLFSEGLLGSGADTYPLVFPQNDFYGKRRAYGHDSVVVTKPHNLYLQMGISLGILSLIGLIWLSVLYSKELFSLLKSGRKIGHEKHLLFAITVGVGGYLSAGLFNDSSVSTGIYFWLLFGVGAGLLQQGKSTKL